MPGTTIFYHPSPKALYPAARVWAWRVLAMLALIASVGCGPDSAMESHTSVVQVQDSGLVFNQTHLQLEKVTFGLKRRGSFYFENKSDQVVRVLRIGPPNCGCTTLTLKLPGHPGFEARQMHGGKIDLEIAPGEVGELEVLFDTSRFRKPVTWRNDSFAFLVEGARGFPLQYSIDVWTPFWLEPWSVDLGRVGVRQKASGFASVKGHDASHFELLVPAEIDGWKFQVARLANTSVDSFNILFEAPEELPLGPFNIRLPLRTDLPDSPELYLSVRGIAVEDLDWSPRRILLRPGKTGANATLQLHNRAVDLPIELQTVLLSGFPEGLIEIQTEVVEVGVHYRVRLAVTDPPDQRLEGKLLLRTDYDDRPNIEIPVVVLPRP